MDDNAVLEDNNDMARARLYSDAEMLLPLRISLSSLWFANCRFVDELDRASMLVAIR